MKLLAVVGTRPEAIKMAPVILALRAEPRIDVRLCVTGQHKEMLHGALGVFGLAPDLDLALMEPGQSLSALAGRCVAALDQVLAANPPDRILVHGDTTTAMATALAGFRCGIPVAHVEAGLRSFDLDRPFPEEMNRRTIDLVADLLFAPTAGAARNLAAERASGRIVITGNTGIDALHIVLARLAEDETLCAEADAALPPHDPDRRLILVTGHRRESFGQGLSNICEALKILARRGDVQIVYPVHLNPKVRGPVGAALADARQILLLPPLEYAPLVRLMQRADLILTDSGGIQEEAPSFGTPVLVLRDVTERPEGIAAGCARLVGTDADRIVLEAEAALDGRAGFTKGRNPYGDGKASARIVASLLGRPAEPFAAA